MELILGTANFGSAYGVANKQKKMTRNQCHEILDFAFLSGVVSLDTARNYTDSESIIGEFHQSGRKFKVFSKVSDLSEKNLSNLELEAHLALKRLKIKKLDGLYFHSSRMLQDYPPKRINIAIEKIIDSGLVDRVGVSVYEEEELNWVVNTFPEIKLFQVPENILDRRLMDSKLVRHLHESGTEFHVRSIFLQGLLLMEPNAIPAHLKNAVPAVESLQEYSENLGFSVLDICLSYLSLVNWASSYVIGVANKEQLNSILQSKSVLLDKSDLPPQLGDFILDPRKWNSK